ncbi:unnamed protein product [Peniophora sp. CBMAI 1063]|nr:unnamed protein product [Peniophora sp. CBMAI 1063]
MSLDWKLPDQTEDSLVFLRVFHAVLGIAIWEYLSTFDYELDIWLGKRRYLWSIWIYSSCRFFLMLWLFTLVVQQNGGITTHCTTFFLVCALFAYLAIGAASVLIALRVVAIWEHRKPIKILSYAMIGASFALNMRDASLVRARYDSNIDACTAVSTYKFLPNGIGILVTDVILVSLMLVGLLRMEEARHSGIVRFLYRQGLVWFTLVVIAEVPTVVLVALNLNDTLTIMLHPFEVSALCICATRLYRSLTDYEHKPDSVNVPPTANSSIHFNSRLADGAE